jgi:hypothetical protein
MLIPEARGKEEDEQALHMSESWAFPLVVFAVSLAAQWFAAYCGSLLRKVIGPLQRDDYSDVDVIRGATLTLLALIIGFSFSMAVNRYDMRKTYEEAEANAIGTEYLRADLLPTDDAAQLRALLKKYLDLRVAFYEANGVSQIEAIAGDTNNLQNELWRTVLPAASAHQTPIVALAVGGLNEVLNSQGYTQAAWWNRLPVGAWAIMGLIAIATNVLLGFSERRKGIVLLLILPVIISTSFLLIADIDSPRGGIIRVLPQNLLALSHTLGASPR